MKKHILSVLLFIFSLACKDNKYELFVLKNPEDTGITHQNTIQSTTELNVFRYRNFYNGGGIGIADINNDGLSDIYFTINRGPNKLYLNKGDFIFEDITETAGVAGTKPWSTRATYTRADLVENLSTSVDEGVAVGILRGQQYAPGGTTALEDRLGNPLTFSPITELVITSQSTIERQGFRARKYVPDARNFDNPANDHIVYRYADALLMRAEAVFRGGSGADAQADLDAIRSRVGLGSISASLDNLYAERARELWLEGWRREDMIRFGTFLDTKELKPSVSDAKYLLYAIPADALINPNMTQNPGY